MTRKNTDNFITESFLSERLNQQTELLVDSFTELITEQLSKFYIRINPILEEVENARIDRELTTEKFRKVEKRLDKLEKATN